MEEGGRGSIVGDGRGLLGGRGLRWGRGSIVGDGRGLLGGRGLRWRREGGAQGWKEEEVGGAWLMAGSADSAIFSLKVNATCQMSVIGFTTMCTIQVMLAPAQSHNFMQDIL